MKSGFINEKHLFNAVMKKIREKGFGLDQESKEYVEGICSELYNFNEFYEDSINENNLKHLIINLLHYVNISETIEDLSDDFVYIKKAMRDYYMFFEGEEVDMTEYELDSFERSEEDLVWDRKNKVYTTYTKETFKFKEDFDKKSGIYLLFKEGELMYVGKSNKDLGNRVLTSASSKDVDSFKYIEIENQADLNIYELFLISSLEPILNKESKTKDKTTFKIPLLETSEMIKIYSEVD